MAHLPRHLRLWLGKLIHLWIFVEWMESNQVESLFGPILEDFGLTDSEVQDDSMQF